MPIKLESGISSIDTLKTPPVMRRLIGFFKPVILRRASAVIGVWGEAGIGKTFVSQNLLTEVAIKSLSVHATIKHTDLARAIPQHARTAAWAGQLLKRISLTGETAAASRFASSIAAALCALAPFALHVEDLHETNPEQLEFWVLLAQAVKRSKGVMLLVTSRTPPPEPFHNQQLESLNRATSDLLLEAEFKMKLPPEAIEWIYAQAAGNPLFTLEFGRFLARTGQLWNDGQDWHWRVPAGNLMPVSIQAVIEQELGRFREHKALINTLEAKAILPMNSSLLLWASVAGLEVKELLAAITELEHHGVLLNAEFIHPLYRETVARQLSSNRRRDLSRRALEVLEHEDVRLAASFIKQANLEPADALAFLTRAAAKATDSGDMSQAASFFAQASEHVHGEARGELALRAAKGLRGANFIFALQLTEIALEMLPENLEVIYELAEMYAANGQIIDAERILERIPTTLRDRPEHWEHLIFIQSWSGNPSEALKLWLEHPHWQEIASPNTIYRVAFSMPQNQERQKLVQKTLECKNLIPLEQAKLLSIIAWVHYEESRLAQAIEVFTQVIELAREAGNRVGEAAMLGNRSNAYYDLDKLEECKSDLEASSKLQAEDGDSLGYAISQQNLAGVFIDHGEYQRAEQTLLEALEVLKSVTHSEFLVDCQAKLTTLYVSWQPPHGKIMALKHAKASLEVARNLELPRAIRKGLDSLAAAETLSGQYALALKYADEASEVYRTNGFGYSCSSQRERAAALEGLGEIGAALQCYQEAANHALETEPLKTQHLIGLEIDRLSRNPQKAPERLAYFEQYGFKYATNLVKKYFPELIENLDPVLANEIQTAPISNPLQLEVLGLTCIKQNDQPTSRGGAKRLELLTSLLEARILGRSEVSQLELIDTIYNETREDQAVQSLKKMVQLVRDQFRRGVIQTTQNGYALGAIKSDAEQFLETGDTTLWRGIYLEGVRLQRNDESVPEVLYHALKTRIKSILELDPKEAARVSRILLEAEPYDTDTLELSLRALRANQNHRSLTRVYTDAKTRFLEVNEHLPERWQDFLEARETVLNP